MTFNFVIAMNSLAGLVLLRLEYIIMIMVVRKIQKVDSSNAVIGFWCQICMSKVNHRTERVILGH